MGFQDRDYIRGEYDDHGYRRPRGGGMSVTMRLVIINFVLFFVNGLFFPQDNLLTKMLLLPPGTLGDPTHWWRFLTSGFVHSPISFWHIFGNMLGLIMFGYGMMLGIGPGGFGLVRGENVEQVLGRGEYLLFYLLTIIFSGVVFSLVNPESASLGASGGVTGVIILFAFLYPKKQLLLYGVIPLPMWAIGLLIVFMDGMGASGVGDGGIAYAAHLGGAAFATFYYFVFLSRRRRMTDVFSVFRKIFAQNPNVKIYREENDKKNNAQNAPKSTEDEKFTKRLDEILDRYGKVGEAGLTAEEREFLQRASKRYRDKR